ncbi:MAG: PGF-pre-PGF domain-containing protein, partial [Chloroflexi bacterium]|nr:PGF-pre-PGF domain-containing protein [Chloroflexota bacterium]
GQAIASAATTNATSTGQAIASAATTNAAATGQAIASAATTNAAATGQAIASAATTNAAATGQAIASAATTNATSTGQAIMTSAATNPTATAQALATGVATNPQASFSLGGVVPATSWAPESAPSSGAAQTGTGMWAPVGSPAPIKAILAKFARLIPGAHIKVEDVSTPPAGAPALPSGQILSEYLRLTPENFQNTDLIASHATFFVTKAWLETNKIHPWSIWFNRYDEERKAWVPFLGKRVQEDARNVYYSVTPPGFSVWAISGSREAPSVQFRVDNLGITPAAAQEGQTITIRADVSNQTDSAADFNAILWLNAQVETSRMVSVPAKATVPVSFTIQPKAGSYEVRVDRLLGKLTVQGPVVTPLPPVVGDVSPTGGLLATLGALGLLLVLSGSYLLRAQRRERP